MKTKEGRRGEVTSTGDGRTAVHLRAGAAQFSRVDVERAFGFTTFLLGPLAVTKSVEVSDHLDSLA